MAFTLAEVLITLGIIGVVAALTIPSLVQNYKKQVIETSLQKFYSTINQAVQLAEIDYGEKKGWYADLAGAQTDKDGNLIAGSSNAEKWFRKYLAPYMNISEIKILSNGTFIVYFPDGSALRQGNPATTRDWHFYVPNNPKKCMNMPYNKSIGSCLFVFNFYPASTEECWKWNYDKGFEPWKFCWNGEYDEMYNACKNGDEYGHGMYCSTLIQYHGWKIPDNYPRKF